MFYSLRFLGSSPGLRPAGLGLIILLTGAPLDAQTVTSISPAHQRVHEIVTLRGSGFGTYQPGISRVVFSGSGVTVEAGTPYVWRDDFIQVRVPVGDLDGATVIPIPKIPLTVEVQLGAATSNPIPFQVITIAPRPLACEQLTQIVADTDVSSFLGDPNLNLARTKDADIGDVNGDGFPDLVDNNSNNEFNGTHAVVRTNEAGKRFSTRRLEPVDDADTGDFATTVPSGGDFVGDAITYDADLVDLNNDSLPEVVHAAAGTPRVRILLNNHQGVAGEFLEDSATWLPSQAWSGSPDDVGHVDVNHDGFVDVAIAARFSPSAEIFLNQAGQTFAAGITVASAQGSMHDVLFIDADDDGFHDVFLVDEFFGDSQLFLHDGNPTPAFTPSVVLSLASGALTGLTADLNGDGLPDLVTAGPGAGNVFLNDPAAPGTFSASPLPAPGTGAHYDLEAGDFDLDGDVDLVGASIVSFDAEQTVRVWLNDGSGSFTNAADPISDLLPGLAPYERLSADLIDFDLDGDLDLYLTGADGQSVASGFGRVPNQFWANRIAEVFADGFESGDLSAW